MDRVFVTFLGVLVSCFALNAAANSGYSIITCYGVLSISGTCNLSYREVQRVNKIATAQGLLIINEGCSSESSESYIHVKTECVKGVLCKNLKEAERSLSAMVMAAQVESNRNKISGVSFGSLGCKVQDLTHE